MGNRLKDHVEHYRKDAEFFDYFHVENPVIREEERRRIQVLIRQMKTRPGQKILDAGSGGGWATQAFLPRGCSVFAVDLSSKNLKTMRDKFDPQARGGYVVADLYKLPFKRCAFDCAISNDVYEHLERLDEAAREMRKVLKDNAEVFVSVPYRENIVYYLCIHCNQPTPINAHLHSFDEDSLGKVFINNGFRVHGITRFINKGLSIFQIYYRLCRWMPYWLWRSVDSLANAIVRKPSRIGMKLIAADRVD